jgi:hypothetical protein
LGKLSEKRWGYGDWGPPPVPPPYWVKSSQPDQVISADKVISTDWSQISLKKLKSSYSIQNNFDL